MFAYVQAQDVGVW